MGTFTNTLSLQSTLRCLVLRIEGELESTPGLCLETSSRLFSADMKTQSWVYLEAKQREEEEEEGWSDKQQLSKSSICIFKKRKRNPGFHFNCKTLENLQPQPANMQTTNWYLWENLERHSSEPCSWYVACTHTYIYFFFFRVKRWEVSCSSGGDGVSWRMRPWGSVSGAGTERGLGPTPGRSTHSLLCKKGRHTKTGFLAKVVKSCSWNIFPNRYLKGT